MMPVSTVNTALEVPTGEVTKVHPKSIKPFTSDALHVDKDLFLFHEKYSYGDVITEEDVLLAIGWEKGDDLQYAKNIASLCGKFSKNSPVIVKDGESYFFGLRCILEKPDCWAVQYREEHFASDTLVYCKKKNVFAVTGKMAHLADTFNPLTHTLSNVDKQVRWSDKKYVRIIKSEDVRIDATLGQESVYAFLKANSGMKCEQTHKEAPLKYAKMRQKQVSANSLGDFYRVRKMSNDEVVAQASVAAISSKRFFDFEIQRRGLETWFKKMKFFFGGVYVY